MEKEDLRTWIRQLEQTDKDLSTKIEGIDRTVSEKMTEMSINMSKLIHTTEVMQQSLIEMTNNMKRIHDMEIKVSNLETMFSAVKYLGGAIVASGVGMVIMFLFGGS